jgi:hypothetical protein
MEPEGSLRIHKFPPPVPILSPLDPVHTPTSHFRKIHLNIILPSTPGISKMVFFLQFSNKNDEYFNVIFSALLSYIAICGK